MTPRLRLDDAPPPPDVRNPRVYRKQVALARMIAQYLEAMPLGEMAVITRDAWATALVRDEDWDAIITLQSDRDVIEALESAQRQLERIRARAGT